MKKKVRIIIKEIRYRDSMRRLLIRVLKILHTKLRYPKVTEIKIKERMYENRENRGGYSLRKRQLNEKK